MHYDSIIVCLTDDHNKTFRESNVRKVDNGRKCDLFLPFDTEYKFLIKKTIPERIILDIEIDGTNITNNGIIVDSNKTFLERFINTNKKFKFVHSDHENVTDPTDPENGIIKVRIHREKKKEYNNYNFPKSYLWTNNEPYKYTKYLNKGDITWTDITQNFSGTLRSTPIMGSSITTNESSATIEGSESSQNIYSSYWNGNYGSPLIFTFFLKGYKKNEIQDKEYLEYLRLKEKFDN